MDNQKDHINHWAKKLEQATTPEKDGWSSMEIILDRNMPVQKPKKGRRWLLMTFFLFLLIGVCNCPGTRTTNNIARNKNNISIQDSISNKSRQAFIAKNNSLKKEPDNIMLGRTSTLKSFVRNEKGYNDYVRGTDDNQTSGFAAKLKVSINRKSKFSTNEPESDQQTTTKVSSALKKDSVSQTTAITKIDSSRKDSHTIPKTVVKTKSPDKKNADKIPDEDKKGFVLTLGLNQFFPVGAQDKTNYNSNGTSGGVTDYIPVPAGRYYFHNWLYLEGELQLNSPQYTKSLLVGQKIGYGTGQPLVQSVFIRKLFYFNVPLSIHFSPVKNLFFGAGIQYSHLTNGVALYQESNYTSGFVPMIPINDSALVYSEVRDFKHDTSYQKLKTSEWRFLLDVNYQWKRFTLGLRYNQAFNNFVNIQISSGAVTQAHNSSLQLYLQYMLWDNRKKIKK